MLNPTNSSKIAKSVQRDYEQDAEIYRLTKDNVYRPHSNALIKVGLTLTTLAAAVTVIVQYLM